MLIGTVLYYVRGGRRLQSMDCDVSPGYAARVSRGDADTIVQWACSNGDPRDVRYYLDGRQLSEQAADAWMGVQS